MSKEHASSISNVVSVLCGDSARKTEIFGGGGGVLSEHGPIFEKNIPGNGEMINHLLDGLSYNTRRKSCSLLLVSLLDNKGIISDKQLFCFLQSLI